MAPPADILSWYEKPHLRMWCVQPQILFKNLPEQQKLLLQDKQQAPQKNRILEHKPHDVIFMYKRNLANEIYRWPLYYSYKWKLMKMKKED